MKLAQIISAGDGVFPYELVNECKRLRDSALAEDLASIEKRLEAELGSPLARIFTEISISPIAAASIAQVHTATLLSGEQVIVKIRRRNIEKTVRRDVQALAWLAPLLIGRLPFAALANPPALVELFAETIVEELDFRIEASSMLAVAGALAAQERRGVIVPRPHPLLVTPGVLVQEKMSGMQLHQIRRSQLDGKNVVQSLLACVLEGALISGVFHGDLHSGNMFVLPDGKIALIDFGITARLSEDERLAFARLITAGMSGDWHEQLVALQGLGALPLDADIESLGRNLGLENPVDVGALSADELTRELQKLSKTLLQSGAKLPKALMLWGKNVAFIDAAIGELAPECDVLAVLAEVALTFAARHGASLYGDLGREITVSETALRTSLGVDAATPSMTWDQLQERRALIAARVRRAFR